MVGLLKLGIDQKIVSLKSVGNELLGAVDDVAVAFLAGHRAEPQNICSDRWLGHAHASDATAVNSPRKIAMTLLVVSVPEEIVYEQDFVGQVAERKGRVGAAEFLMHNNFRDGVHAGPTELLADSQPEKPQFASNPSKQLDIELFPFVLSAGLLLHGVETEPLCHRPQVAMGRRRIKQIERRGLGSGSGLNQGGYATHNTEIIHWTTCGEQFF